MIKNTPEHYDAENLERRGTKMLLSLARVAVMDLLSGDPRMA